MRAVATDFELLDAWRAGDASAGNELFRRYFDAMYRFFRNKVSTGVDDLIQRTFLACVEKRDTYRGDASFRTFLFAIARLELFAAYRRKNRLARETDVGLSSVHDLAPSPSRIAADRQEQRLIVEGLRRIPLDTQIALELYYWEDLTAPDIADVLDVPVGTVRSRIRRGKELLGEQVRRLAAAGQLPEHSAADLERWARELRAQVQPDGEAD